MSYPIRLNEFVKYYNKRYRLWLFKCPHCQKEFKNRHIERKYCSLSCARRDRKSGFMDKKHSEKTKRKMSRSAKRIYNDGTKKKLIGKNNPFYGKRHTNETKDILRKKATNREKSDKTRKKLSVANKGRILTDEWKKKIGSSNKGNCRSDMIGKNNPNYGGFSESHIQSIRNTYINGRKVPHGIGRGKQGFRKDLGHHVRSTWEANVARILIYEGMQYEFEPKRFDLGEMTYLPDFYIPSKQLYIEVKGYMTERAKTQIELFSKDHWLLVIDENMYNDLANNYKDILTNWE